MIKKKTFTMWANKDWHKKKISDLKEGLGYQGWRNSKQQFYPTLFNPYQYSEFHTDNKGDNVVKVEVTIVQRKKR